MMAATDKKPASLSLLFGGALFCALLTGTLPSLAAPKNGNHSCTIMVNDTGILHANPGASVLSSSGLGGKSGRATITTTNGSYEAVVDVPFGFASAPQDGNQNTQFGASMSASGDTNFLSVPAGFPQKLKKGTTDISVDFEARRLTGGFPPGNYRAAVVLRCE